MHAGRTLTFLTMCLLTTVGVVLASQWSEVDVAPSAAGPKAPIELNDHSLLSVHRADTSDGARLTVVRKPLESAWTELSLIAEDESGVDLGDPHLLQLRDGRLWCSFRRNRYRGKEVDSPRYAIEIAESVDAGKTWHTHSTVAGVQHPSRPRHSQGLWSSFILERKNGTLQCYFDDEDSPARQGFVGHQWLTMKTWNAETSHWSEPVTVSRARDDKDLSRDGMPTVIERDDGTLLAVFESVQTSRPNANCIRSVTSADGGRTWSWRDRERAIVYAPKDDRFNALAPWMIRLRNGNLFVVFCTDEDRDEPDRSGTSPSRMHLDVKATESCDGGNTWSTPDVVWAGEHRAYLPGVVERSDGGLEVHFVDYGLHGTRVIERRK